ncbi:hypothetical protein LCGC14_2833540, partial [marine sediment metagenome]
MGIGKSLKALLGSVAPLLGVSLGGPMGGVAMKFLADKFTGGDTGSVEDFLLSANPETLQALKVAELEFKQEMKKLDIDLEQIAADDRSSARDLAKERGITPQVILSVVYTTGYFGVLFMFMTGHLNVPAEYSSMFSGLLGVLSAAQVQIMNFWFGSSSGSKRKTEVIA